MKDNKSQGCLFCLIYEQQRDIIYENEYFYARFDKFPVSPGHLEIIPKRHLVSMFDLSIFEWEHLFPAIKDNRKIIESIDLKDIYARFLVNPFNQSSQDYCQQALSSLDIKKLPDGYNIGVNEGVAAGRSIDHFHLHIIPRYQGDVENPRGGIRNIIPNKGDY